jgi:hypothetical protein
MRFNEAYNGIKYGASSYDADKLLEYLLEVKENLGQIRHDLGMFSLDSVLSLDVASRVTETPEYEEFEAEHAGIFNAIDGAEDFLTDATDLLEEAIYSLKKQPRYNALDKDEQERLKKEREMTL